MMCQKKNSPQDDVPRSLYLVDRPERRVSLAHLPYGRIARTVREYRPARAAKSARPRHYGPADRRAAAANVVRPRRIRRLLRVRARASGRPLHRFIPERETGRLQRGRFLQESVARDVGLGRQGRAVREGS